MIIELDNRGFDVAIREDDRLVLVDFWAPWCGPCRVQLPILERIAADAGIAYRVVKVNVDDNEQLALRYKITSIPTLLLFHQGEPIKRFTGVQQESVIRAALESAAASLTNTTGADHAPTNVFAKTGP